MRRPSPSHNRAQMPQGITPPNPSHPHIKANRSTKKQRKKQTRSTLSLFPHLMEGPHHILYTSAGHAPPDK